MNDLKLQSEIKTWIKQRPKRVKSFYINAVIKGLNIEYTEDNKNKVRDILWNLAVTENPLIDIGYHHSCDNCGYDNTVVCLDDIPDICPVCENKIDLETVWIEYVINNNIKNK